MYVIFFDAGRYETGLVARVYISLEMFERLEADCSAFVACFSLVSEVFESISRTIYVAVRPSVAATGVLVALCSSCRSIRPISLSRNAYFSSALRLFLRLILFSFNSENSDDKGR